MNTTVDKIKCGQIFILSNDIFSLVCEFCGKDYRKLDDFVLHITNHFPETPTIIKREDAIKQEDIAKPADSERQKDAIKQEDSARQEDAIKQEDSTRQEDSVRQEDATKQEDSARQEDAIKQDIAKQEKSVNQEELDKPQEDVIFCEIFCDSEDELVPAEIPEEILTDGLQDGVGSQTTSTDSLNDVWELLSVEDNQSSDEALSEQMPTIRINEFLSTSAHANKSTTDRDQIVMPVTSHSQRPPSQLRKEIIVDLTEERQTNNISIKKSRGGGLKCNICALVFYSRLSFQDHINLHTGSRPHQCKLCPQTFAQATSLELHTKKQHKKHKQCTNCGKKFAKQCKLDYHIRERHLPDNDPRRFFPCKVCNVKFDRLHKLHTHSSRMHNQKSVFTCDYCKRQFNSRSIIELHMQIHSGNKNYNCKHCGTKFTEIAPKLRHELNCTVQSC